jgi:hypothetical protein
MSNPAKTKAAYTKPSLIEYGSLTQRTKILSNRDPDELAAPDEGLIFSLVSTHFLTT